MRHFLHRLTCVALLAAALTTDALPMSEPGVASAHHHGETVWRIGKPNTPRIGLIGDSTMAALRWRNAYGDLHDFNFVYNAESCRRTIDTSCRGREGYPPANALTTLRYHSGQWGRVLIMMTGYNDPGTRFGEGVDAIVGEARRQGIHKVIWLTMRTADVSYEAPGYRSNSYTFRDNNRILLQKAVQHRGYLQIADWATYSANRSDWVGSDGIHLTHSGSLAVANFVRNQTRQVLNGRTITPAPNASGHASWSPLRQGDRGSRVVSLQRALMNAGISVYGGADGHFGSYTRDAVIRYQRREGLNVTGVVYERMAIKLGIYTPPPPQIAKPSCTISRALFPDDRLPDVRCLKRHLVADGFAMYLGNDHYGPQVADAVEYYKAVRGYKVDGIARRPMLQELGAWKNPPPRPDCTVSRQLQPGDTLADVACLKRHLASRGYKMVVDRNYGTLPTVAVRHLKNSMGLPNNGIAGRTFLQRIGAWKNRPSPPACRISRQLEPGDELSDVRCLKQHLAARGYQQTFSPEFGEIPRLAMRHLKTNLGLGNNAIAGRDFLQRIGAWENRPPRPGCRISQRLEPGDTGPDVVCLKRHLASRGYQQILSPEFGNVPRMAVRHLKTNLGLGNNAIAGREFLERIGAWENPTVAHAETASAEEGTGDQDEPGATDPAPPVDDDPASPTTTAGTSSTVVTTDADPTDVTGPADPTEAGTPSSEPPATSTSDTSVSTTTSGEPPASEWGSTADPAPPTGSTTPPPDAGPEQGS